MDRASSADLTNFLSFAYTNFVSLTAPNILSRWSYMQILLRVILLLLLPYSPPLWAADEAKRVLALIDCIGGDYRNAVQAGKVVNPTNTPRWPNSPRAAWNCSTNSSPPKATKRVSKTV
jgi:hypothetical protein